MYSGLFFLHCIYQTVWVSRLALSASTWLGESSLIGFFFFKEVFASVCQGGIVCLLCGNHFAFCSHDIAASQLSEERKRVRHWGVRRTGETWREGWRNLAGDKWKEVWIIGVVVRRNGGAEGRQLLKHANKEREKWCDEMKGGRGEVKVAAE